MYEILVEMLKGWGEGVTFLCKIWKFRGGGGGGVGAYVKFPLWSGYEYSRELHILIFNFSKFICFT